MQEAAGGHNGVAKDVVVTLVSVAIGQPYERSLDRMGASAADAGFNRTQLWKEDAFLADPLVQRHRGALEQMQRGHRRRKRKHPQDRPYCGAFKSFALLHALESSREGDYVMWADASKYHDARYRDVNVHDAIATLTGARRPARPAARRIVSAAYSQHGWLENVTHEPRRTAHSAYGVLHCGVGSCDAQLFLPNAYRSTINVRTMSGFSSYYAGDVQMMGRRPHIMNANILLENNAFNRELMRRWVRMAVEKPDLFCDSITQEQGIFTLLIMGARLPMVNACPYMRIDGFNKCQDVTKSSRWFLETLGRGAFEVATADEIDGDLVPGHTRLQEMWHRGETADAHVPGRVAPGRPVMTCCTAHNRKRWHDATTAFGDSLGFDCCRHVPCAAPRYVRALCDYARGVKGSLLP